MGLEYKICFPVPADFSDEGLSKRLPDSASPDSKWAEYNWSVEPYGFYFLDNLGNANISSRAFRCLIDEALRHSTQVVVEEL